MGLLDDAIREHLELKRRHGADADEVQRQEQEVFGEARLPQPGDPPRSPEPGEPDEPGEPADPAAAVAGEGEESSVAAAGVEPAPPPAPDPEPAPRAAPTDPAPPHGDELPAGRFADDEPWLDEPDEVPVHEALEHPRRGQPTTEFTPEDVAAAHGEPEYVAPDDEPGEDLLEETPEFLQETPEHDRLWFEQKPPRDFDFGS